MLAGRTAATGSSCAGGARVSVVIPARDEGDQVIGVLARLLEAVRLPCEVLVVVDSESDPTAQVVSELAVPEARLRLLVNEYGPGPANAIRYGIDAASAPVAAIPALVQVRVRAAADRRAGPGTYGHP
jgi:dolichol-phosphate mannosyltransferase